MILKISLISKFLVPYTKNRIVVTSVSVQVSWSLVANSLPGPPAFSWCWGRIYASCLFWDSKHNETHFFPSKVPCIRIPITGLISGLRFCGHCHFLFVTALEPARSLSLPEVLQASTPHVAFHPESPAGPLTQDLTLLFLTLLAPLYSNSHHIAL